MDCYSAPSLLTSIRSFGLTAMSLMLILSDVKSKGGFPSLLTAPFNNMGTLKFKA